MSWTLPCCSHEEVVQKHHMRNIVEQMSCEELDRLIRRIETEHVFTGTPSMTDIVLMYVLIIGGSQLAFWLVRKSTEKLDPSLEKE